MDKKDVMYLILSKMFLVLMFLLKIWQSIDQVSTNSGFTDEERGEDRMNICRTSFACDCCLTFYCCCKTLLNEISLFTSVIRLQNAFGDIQNAPPSTSVSEHSSKKVSDISNLTTTSVVGASMWLGRRFKIV